MSNTNCLLGIRCPNCKQEERFYIIGTTQFEVYDDGTHGHNDIEWDDDAVITCPACERQGKLKEFRAMTEEETEQLVRAIIQRCYDDFKWMRDVVEAHVEHTCDLQTYREFFEEEDGE